MIRSSIQLARGDSSARWHLKIIDSDAKEGNATSTTRPACMPQGVIQSGEGELIRKKDDLGLQVPER